ATPSLVQQVLEAQKTDQEVAFIKHQLSNQGSAQGWELRANGGLTYQGKIFVPNTDGLRNQ
ncbi:hypothetical protein U1Q18_042682, partial [Sarracenia purpurea var. burkii]